MHFGNNCSWVTMVLCFSFSIVCTCCLLCYWFDLVFDEFLGDKEPTKIEDLPHSQSNQTKHWEDTEVQDTVTCGFCFNKKKEIINMTTCKSQIRNIFFKNTLSRKLRNLKIMEFCLRIISIKLWIIRVFFILNSIFSHFTSQWWHSPNY